MPQDTWIIKNQTNRYLSVGDLQKLPALWPGKVVNVLNYYDQDTISNSAALKDMLNRGWLTITKTKNGTSTRYDNTNDSDEAITTAERKDTVDLESRVSDIEAGGVTGITSVVQDESPELGGELNARENKIINLATPTNNLDAATKEYVDNSIGVAINYYFTDTASDIGTYYEMDNIDQGAAASTIVVSGIDTGEDQLFAAFATPSGGTGLTNFREGIYELHTHLERTNGNKPLRIYAEIYTRTAGGVETLRATTSQTNLITTESDFDLIASLTEEVAINETDRIVIKFYVNAGSSGGLSELTFYMEDNYDSNILIPTTFQTFSNVFLRLDGNNQMQGDIDLGGNNINSVGSIKKNIVTVTSASYSAISSNSFILADDDTAGGVVTITLPTANGNSGLEYKVKKIGSTANVVIDGNESETIDGATTTTLTVQYESITIVCDGSNWWIIQ